ncbi:hypothetical protein AVEN_211885-1 [Araneus ventricosus]|uniref:Uncharacterized protein n=1 Tax=Araneus ventricosus TaxID=182803 RepID=A0A4Y2F1E5_ARAVE|nr:hypothetical protein AVEN_211885-1 [Araneus ventricosus]
MVARLRVNRLAAEAVSSPWCRRPPQQRSRQAVGRIATCTDPASNKRPPQKRQNGSPTENRPFAPRHRLRQLFTERNLSFNEPNNIT